MWGSLSACSGVSGRRVASRSSGLVKSSGGMLIGCYGICGGSGSGRFAVGVKQRLEQEKKQIPAG